MPSAATPRYIAQTGGDQPGSTAGSVGSAVGAAPACRSAVKARTSIAPSAVGSVTRTVSWSAVTEAGSVAVT